MGDLNVSRQILLPNLIWERKTVVFSRKDYVRTLVVKGSLNLIRPSSTSPDYNWNMVIRKTGTSNANYDVMGAKSHKALVFEGFRYRFISGEISWECKIIWQTDIL